MPSPEIIDLVSDSEDEEAPVGVGAEKVALVNGAVEEEEEDDDIIWLDESGQDIPKQKKPVPITIPITAKAKVEKDVDDTPPLLLPETGTSTLPSPIHSDSSEEVVDVVGITENGTGVEDLRSEVSSPPPPVLEPEPDTPYKPLSPEYSVSSMDIGEVMRCRVKVEEEEEEENDDDDSSSSSNGNDDDVSIWRSGDYEEQMEKLGLDSELPGGEEAASLFSVKIHTTSILKKPNSRPGSSLSMGDEPSRIRGQKRVSFSGVDMIARIFTRHQYDQLCETERYFESLQMAQEDLEQTDTIIISNITSGGTSPDKLQEEADTTLDLPEDMSIPPSFVEELAPSPPDSPGEFRTTSSDSPEVGTPLGKDAPAPVDEKDYDEFEQELEDYVGNININSHKEFPPLSSSIGCQTTGIDSEVTVQRKEELKQEEVPKDKPRRKRKRPRAEDYEILEKRFKENSHEFHITDYWEMEQLTGMSQYQIKAWYKQRKLEVGTADELLNEMNGFDDSLPPNQDELNRFIEARERESQLHAEALEKELEELENGRDGICRSASPVPSENGICPSIASSLESISTGERTRRFLIYPSQRTTDISLVRSDIQSVKEVNLTDFAHLLNTKWTKKANRLFVVATHMTYGLGATLFTESRRLKEINSVLSPLSKEQEEESMKWKHRFIDEKYKLSKKDSDALFKIEHVVNEVVAPWLAPFVYGRATTQNGRWLALSVALHDFCRVTNKLECMTWKTPWLLQYDIAEA